MISAIPATAYRYLVNLPGVRFRTKAFEIPVCGRWVFSSFT